MRLSDFQCTEARLVQGFETQRAIDAKRCQRDVPVPAKIALRLAQHVAVRNRAIAEVIRNEVRLVVLCISGGANVRAKPDLDRILAGLEYLRQVGAIFAKHIAALQNGLLVNQDVGNRVDFRQNKGQISPFD